ncbi:MAG: glycosyltransferase family protein [Solirubrobacterales bacterium]
MRSVFICNEMLGLGHLGVSLAIAAELVATPEDSALVITGSPAYKSMRVPQGVELLKVPTAVPGVDSAWSKTGLRPPGEHALAPEEVSALRAEAYRDAIERINPDALIVDYRPLGRDRDLVPALEVADASGSCQIALGIWDCDDSPDGIRAQWAPELIERAADFYDVAFVYGPPAPDDIRVNALGAAGIPIEVVDFVSGPPAVAPAPDLPAGYLLASTGGGADGFATLDAVLAAIRLRPIPTHTVLVTGPLMPQDDVVRLRLSAEGVDATIFESRADLPELLFGARAVVSMAGYSTTAEILASGKPALMIPRAVPREEQLNRAKRLAESGRVSLLEPKNLNAETMRDALSGLLEQKPRTPERLCGVSDVRRFLHANLDK